jgi:hypothetical protein
MMEYVTFDSETGALTGAYMQDLLPEHEQHHIQVSEDQRMNWPLYRMNAARDGLEPLPPVQLPVVVPQEVTRRQGFQALFLAGVTEADVEAVINQIPDETARGLALIELRTAQTFERQRPLVLQAGAALGLDLDELFITAAGL